MSYAIDQSKPLRAPIRSLYGNSRPDSLMATLRRLEVGESVYVDRGQKQLGCQSKIYGKKFTSRIEGEGTRIWRIS